MIPDTTLETSSLSVRRTIRYVEWIVIVMYALLVASGSGLHKTLTPVLIKAMFLVGMFGLSWIFPSDRPRWQRVIYILTGISAIFTVRLVGFLPYFLMYLYFTKARLLLSLKTTIFIAIATTVIDTITFPLVLPIFAHLDPDWNPDLTDPRLVATITINNFVIVLACSSFVIWLGTVLVEEQRSRQRAEALSREIEYLAAKLERTRIARDIHDSLGHTITNLDIHLSVAQKLRERNPEQALQSLNTAKLLSSQCIEEISHAVQTMRDVNFNLSQALTTLVDRVKQTTHLEVTAEIDIPELPTQKSHHLYCILKEGFTNIQKHARASEVYLKCCSTAKGIWLELRDNGCGFDPVRSFTGFGLQGMQERVNLLGGTLEIHSHAGSGTQIQVLIPYDSSATC